MPLPVKFKTPRTRVQIQTLLEDYFRGIGTVERRGDCYRCELPGCSSNAMARLSVKPLPLPSQYRVIEVWSGRGALEVVTHAPDEITAAIAEGLLAVIRKCWKEDLLSPGA